ncbi:hypothetical protein B9479_008171, partial [Cryptococcus floricola]
MLPHDDPATKALPAGGVPHDDLPPPIGGVAPEAKLEEERREAKDEGESGDETSDATTENATTEREKSEKDKTGSHEESVHSDPRPRLRQDTPWAGPAPATDMAAIIAMMANMQQQSAAMQQQMQQQSAAIIDLLAREKSTPAPAPAPAPAPSSVSTPERARIFKRPDKLVCPTLTCVTKDPFIIIRHLHALKAHLDMGLFSIDSKFYHQWEIEQCNLSISRVGQWVTWAREEGTREATFTGWSKAWKEHVLELLISKYQQAVQANRHRRPEPTYAVGDKVSIDTADFQHQYKTTTHRSAKKLLDDMRQNSSLTKNPTRITKIQLFAYWNALQPQNLHVSSRYLMRKPIGLVPLTPRFD